VVNCSCIVLHLHTSLRGRTAVSSHVAMAAPCIMLHLQAAVKVLDSSSSSGLLLQPTAAAGTLSLSSLLSSSLKHSNLVGTLAWAVVQAQPAAAAAAAAGGQVHLQSVMGCSSSAAEGCSAIAAGAGVGQTWLVQEYCDRGCLQVRALLAAYGAASLLLSSCWCAVFGATLACWGPCPSSLFIVNTCAVF
jgi:hypothetical protein